ncbi:hypothetical protein [Micromonospora sicca]|uniref:hypothetical protein n=1 Tax=Micromonospora sicca TaxID=2202420 RepID=UPI001F183E89|nr:hypothetical protein [Micromonospora sp. 4G51]
MATTATTRDAGVSRPATAPPENRLRRALSLLHDRELIRGQPGRGTYVAEGPGR